VTAQDRSAPLDRSARLRRYRELRRRIAPRSSLRAFEALVIGALDELPDFVRARLDNVAVVVEEWPPADQDLLGLYEGVSRLERSGGDHAAVPDRITVFRQPILEEVGRGDPAAIVREVRATVRHEVAHYLGMSDAELEELERSTPP
jgi:predicted Zn-dependent protease with MMP-like domain